MPLRRISAVVPVACLVVLAACGGQPDAPRISDSGFVEAAETLCRRELPPLRADLADDDPREPAEVAPTVRARAASLRSLVSQLKDLRVAADDEPKVSDWLDDWDEYVAVGTRYADALDEGDAERYSAVADEGLGPQARISAFARVNGFESCALDGVPLPPREGL